jgi:RNA recognition motif-containing protein
MKLYVGNLSFNTTENDLEDLFNQYGTVSEVALMTDHATGRSRGFAFVTMGSAAEGNAAIEATNGKQVKPALVKIAVLVVVAAAAVVAVMAASAVRIPSPVVNP